MDPIDSNNSLNDEALLASLALTLVTGVGPHLQANLLNAFGDAASVFKQSVESLLSVDGVGPKVASQIISGKHQSTAVEMRNRCTELNVGLLQKGIAPYPSILSDVNDSPAILYVRGQLLPQDELAIAIVGSRRCTAYGRRQAERLASSLARAGFTIVSGLARGIDAAAHRGALNAGGRTIAVMATGVREIYPPEHAELAVNVTESGALVSEFPLDQKPRPGLFPQRNRIISGLSLGVIVVEATRNSGSLYTARHAMEQGREVFALPGNVDSLASEGSHDLIRDGVTLIRNVDDVLSELGPLAKPATSRDEMPVHDPRELNLNPQEKEILNHIGSSPIHVEDILRSTQLELSRVLSTLTVLEMKRFIRRLPGNLMVRNH